nr:SUN domain-containing protein 2 [Labrus bergylta]XP_020500160.1 SUN domain-containing protein 2 [Labrus bergylta]
MSRRSSRLVSGGYYNSDEESDSSSVTNISYRENPVKVFKKKSGNRKSGSHTPSRTKSNTRSSSPEQLDPVDQCDGLSVSASTSQNQTTMRTIPYVTATPRPALTPSSARSQTPTRCPSVPPETRFYTAGLHSPSIQGLHLRPNPKELSQSSVDSSGYSSSEGNHRKPTAFTSRIQSNSGAPSAGYRSRISSALFGLMDSFSLMADAVHSKVIHLTALAYGSISSNMKKACGLFILLLILLLCIWFFLPVLTSLTSRMTVTKTPSQIKPQSQPVILSTPPPPPQPNAMHLTPVVDPAIVSAAVEAKMQGLKEELKLTQIELQRKQEHLLSQMKERVQMDMQDMKAKLDVVDVNSRLRLEQEVAGLGKTMVDHQTHSSNTAAILTLKIQALEAQNSKLSQELSSIQLSTPAPCPQTHSAPIDNHLTPELQQAMEAWLTDHIKEQDAIRLRDKGSSPDCGRPMADKMADFALETQGASMISTRCSETYRIRSACVTLFGIPLWYPSESPRTVIQGYPVLLPGKCWAFHGVEGTLVISLSHPIRITHVTLDHLPRYNSPTGTIESAPKDFEVYGMKDDTEEGTLLGTFTYNEDGESTQTFKLPNPSDAVYRYVELRVLTNWGHVEYTCLYRFRVHGQIAST